MKEFQMPKEILEALYPKRETEDGKLNLEPICGQIRSEAQITDEFRHRSLIDYVCPIEVAIATRKLEKITAAPYVFEQTFVTAFKRGCKSDILQIKIDTPDKGLNNIISFFREKANLGVELVIMYYDGSSKNTAVEITTTSDDEGKLTEIAKLTDAKAYTIDAERKRITFTF